MAGHMGFTTLRQNRAITCVHLVQSNASNNLTARPVGSLDGRLALCRQYGQTSGDPRRGGEGGVHHVRHPAGHERGPVVVQETVVPPV